MGRWEHRYLGWDRFPDPSTPLEIEHLFTLEADEPVLIFTGGDLLVGSVGRPDLLGRALRQREVVPHPGAPHALEELLLDRVAGGILLTGVQGVGARVALQILSALEPAELSRAVMSGDKATVARANGVFRVVARA